MSTKLQNLAWQTSCCGAAQYVEHQTANGEWLRIIKPFVGGYRVTVFGADKMLKTPEAEMSADEVDALLT